MTKMQELLKASDQSVRRAFESVTDQVLQGITGIDAKELEKQRVKSFWDERKRLDSEMEV